VFHERNEYPAKARKLNNNTKTIVNQELYTT
jgi:hypothetical protein